MKHGYTKDGKRLPFAVRGRASLSAAADEGKTKGRRRESQVTEEEERV